MERRERRVRRPVRCERCRIVRCMGISVAGEGRGNFVRQGLRQRRHGRRSRNFLRPCGVQRTCEAGLDGEPRPPRSPAETSHTGGTGVPPTFSIPQTIECTEGVAVVGRRDGIRRTVQVGVVRRRTDRGPDGRRSGNGEVRGIGRVGESRHTSIVSPGLHWRSGHAGIVRP